MTRHLIPALAAAAAFAPAAAMAQAAPTILVVDVQRAVTESSAGQSLAAQVRPQAEQVQQLQKSRQAQFDKEIADLQQAAQAKAVAQDVLVQRQRDLQQRAQTATTELEGRARAVQQAEQGGLQQIGQAMTPIVAQLMREKNAQMVLRRDAVIQAAPTVDITQDVITRLNTALPRVTATAPAAGSAQRPATTPARPATPPKK